MQYVMQNVSIQRCRQGDLPRDRGLRPCIVRFHPGRKRSLAPDNKGGRILRLGQIIVNSDTRRAPSRSAGASAVARTCARATATLRVFALAVLRHYRVLAGGLGNSDLTVVTPLESPGRTVQGRDCSLQYFTFGGDRFRWGLCCSGHHASTVATQLKSVTQSGVGSSAYRCEYQGENATISRAESIGEITGGSGIRGT
jgi:hypothetical protein